MNGLKDAFEVLINEWLPRILTQMNRDPTTTSYGCADRNWWHYKIRDFPSIILQQAGYTVYLAGMLPNWAVHQEGFNKLSRASCEFWSDEVASRKTFDEYFPWEDGYPPVAFSTLSVMRLLQKGIVSPERIRPGVALAIRRLLNRFEIRAVNQQIAGMAALVLARKFYSDLISEQDLEAVVMRTLSLQDGEGWFEEYGGPDLGYLSVSIDCLWDAFDASADDRFLATLTRAVDFIFKVTVFDGKSIGMHNSRNTDYIVPYGLFRVAFEASLSCGTRNNAKVLVQRLYDDLDDPMHFIRATDDRYLCHYIGVSVMRTVLLLMECQSIELQPKYFDCKRPGFKNAWHLPSSGYIILPNGLVSLKKGGVLTLTSDSGERLGDYGWRLKSKGNHYVSHWWSQSWKVSTEGEKWGVSGYLVKCKEHVSAPWKHVILRIFAFVFGYRLTILLKNALIFRKHSSPYKLTRTIQFDAQQVIINDVISGLSFDTTPQRALRFSRRHVASADSYNPLDFSHSFSGWRVTCRIDRTDDLWKATTIYAPVLPE